MKKAAFFICILSACVHTAKSQKYAVSHIPDSVRESSDLVIREDLLEFEVLSKGKGTRRVKVVKTILNSDAESHSKLIAFYNDFNKLTSISAKVYNRLGIQTNEWKKKDFEDWAAYDGISVYSDNRIKSLDIDYPSYPYTVEFQYTVQNDGLMFYPRFTFNTDDGVVEHSVLKITMPASETLRYKLQNAPEPDVASNAETNIYTWALKDLEQFQRAPYSGPAGKQLIKVFTAPKAFEFGGYTGSMESWEHLGQFQNQLLQDLEPLPLLKREQIRSLVANANSDREKIEIVYKYLQENFRYVSVQLGIGGWQPFSPQFVDEKGYGDCKALSFYTKSLLDVVGVESLYTLVEAGPNPRPLDKNFSISSFNHVILCAPNHGDTLWLECTSQTGPLGYSGKFTGNRDVLLVTADGGKVVRTPNYTEEDNTQFRIATINISKDNSAEFKIETTYRGTQYENDGLHFVLHQGQDQKEEWVSENLNLADFRIAAFKFENNPEVIPDATVRISGSSQNLVSGSSKRAFLQPNLLNTWTFVPDENDKRVEDVIISESFHDIDSIWFEMPDSMFPEYLPNATSISVPFGEYSSEVINNEGKLLYVRKMILREGTYPPSYYNELRGFLKKVTKADKAKVVLSKRT